MNQNSGYQRPFAPMGAAAGTEITSDYFDETTRLR